MSITNDVLNRVSPCIFCVQQQYYHGYKRQQYLLLLLLLYRYTGIIYSAAECSASRLQVLYTAVVLRMIYCCMAGTRYEKKSSANNQAPTIQCEPEIK